MKSVIRPGPAIGTRPVSGRPRPQGVPRVVGPVNIPSIKVLLAPPLHDDDDFTKLNLASNCETFSVLLFPLWFSQTIIRLKTMALILLYRSFLHLPTDGAKQPTAVAL